jgi:glycosyltransferase involved in cell wall biosynthesis
VNGRESDRARRGEDGHEREHPPRFPPQEEDGAQHEEAHHEVEPTGTGIGEQDSGEERREDRGRAEPTAATRTAGDRALADDERRGDEKGDVDVRVLEETLRSRPVVHEDLVPREGDENRDDRGERGDGRGDDVCPRHQVRLPVGVEPGSEPDGEDEYVERDREVERCARGIDDLHGGEQVERNEKHREPNDARGNPGPFQLPRGDRDSDGDAEDEVRRGGFELHDGEQEHSEPDENVVADRGEGQRPEHADAEDEHGGCARRLPRQQNGERQRECEQRDADERPAGEAPESAPEKAVFGRSECRRARNRRRHRPPASRRRVTGISAVVAETPRLLILVTLAEIGGAQTFVATLLPAVTERYDVVVAAHGPGPLRAAAEAAGARFEPLDHLVRSVSPWHDPSALAELLSLCRHVRPHIVHANSSKAAVLGVLAARVARVPVRLYTVGGWPFRRSSGLRSRLYLSGDRLVGRLATRIVCVCEAERREALEARVCALERTTVIHNAVDVEAAQKADPGHEVPTILSVGRLAEPKDFVTLARALARLEPRRFRAQIVGDGPDRERLEAEVTRLGLAGTVQLLGERHDVSTLSAQADVFVLSSRSEGLPLAVIEAMAAGLPIVASAVGGISELVGPAGLTVPAGDPAALAVSLGRLVDDAQLRRAYGAAARQRALAMFDLPRFHRAYLDLYATELERAGVGAP